MKKFVIILLFVFVLAGCASKEVSRPDDVRESIWYTGKELTFLLKEKMSISKKDRHDEHGKLNRDDLVKLMEFNNKYEDAILDSIEYTSTESKIVSNIFFMHLNYEKYLDSLDGSNGQAEENFKIMAKELEDIFGK